MAAVAAQGRTVLRNAAVASRMCRTSPDLLVAMGAHIEGIGTNIYDIEGGRPLHGDRYTIGPDHIEIGSLHRARRRHQRRSPSRASGPTTSARTLLGFERLGVRARVDGDQPHRRPRVRSGGSAPDLGGHVPKLEDGPWPAFPADVMSIALVTATQCDGMILIFEKMFESRLFFVDKLIGMGARIVLCDPHRAVISGPSSFAAGRSRVPDIRAGMAMLLAALAAEEEHDQQHRPDRAGLRADRRAASGPSAPRSSVSTADEVPVPGTVPLWEVPGWRERFGVVAGITGRGDNPATFRPRALE